MGPEAKLYQKFKKATPTILWNRIENLAVPGMPDALGYTEKLIIFTVEFKVTKGNKVRLIHIKLHGMCTSIQQLHLR